MVDAKDHANLIRAFSILHQNNKNLYLALIGDGPLRDSTEELAKSLGIIANVFFLGVQMDIPAWMSAADIFVLSSAWEGFGLVVAEAMSCERVVVATDCGGVKEVIGQHGFLVPIKNSTALANEISKAISLPDKEKLVKGQRARNHVVLNYSLDNITEKWLQLYANEECHA